jgi:tetratricopeptide (TPR) repeat protein
VRERVAGLDIIRPGGVVANVRAVAQAFPGYAFAAFVHLFVIVVLSLLTVARAIEQHVSRPVEVRLVAQSDLETTPVDEKAKALDDVAPPEPDLTAELDTDDPFQEAMGQTIGHLQGAAQATMGLAGGGGAGRGGNRFGVGGASRASDGALRAGLDWLARHQSPDGGWNRMPAGHTHSGRLEADSDIGVTSMALLCFICADEGPEKDGPYREVVRRAIDWLAALVDRNGNFGDRFSGYEQSVATLVLSEVLARNRTPELEAAVTRAVQCLEAAQDRTGGGWRYRPHDVADTSVTCWAALALRAAEHAGVKVDKATWGAVRVLVDSVSDPDGNTRYMASHKRAGPGMIASGLFLRLMLGEKPTTPRNLEATRLTAAIADTPVNAHDAYATYYAALALYQVGGQTWREFNPKVRDSTVAAQTGGTGCERGSWKNGGYWLSQDVTLSTAFAVLTLETYYRYLPVHEGGGRSRELMVGAATEGQKLLARGGALLEGALEAKDDGQLLAAEATISDALAALEKEEFEGVGELRLEARGWLVVAAAAAGDPDLALSRGDEYLAALPPSEAADLQVLVARRSALLDKALALSKRADDATTPEARARVETDLLAIEQTLRDDVARHPTASTREEAAAAADMLGKMRRRLALFLNPDLGIADAQRALAKTPATGPASEDEVLLIMAVLTRAQKAFVGPARAQRAALERAEADLAWVAERSVAQRLQGPERQSVVESIARTRVLHLAALHAHERDRDVLKAAPALHTLLIELRDEKSSVTLGALERSSLVRLLERGEGTEDDRARLVDLVLSGPMSSSGAERPAAWISVAEILLGQGAVAEAGRCADRALACDPPPNQEEQNRARIIRIRAAVHAGQVAGADADVTALEQAGLGQRVDVRLARCAVQRAKGQFDEALTGYQAIVRALDAEKNAPWWEAIEAIATTYVEKGDRRQARRYLDELRRVDRTFGGDKAREARLVKLMGWLDANP